MFLTISSQLSMSSDSVAIPGAEGGFAGGLGDGLGGGIAEGEEDLAGFLAVFAGEFGEGVAERLEAEILGAGGALDAVEEGGEVNEFVAGVHKVKIKDLLAGHRIYYAIQGNVASMAERGNVGGAVAGGELRGAAIQRRTWRAEALGAHMSTL